MINRIREIASSAGITVQVYSFALRDKVTTRKSPCGSGSSTFDRFEMRIHKSFRYAV